MWVPWIGARQTADLDRRRGELQLVQDPAADALLESNPFALLVGMLLDHRFLSRWHSPLRSRPHRRREREEDR